MGSVEESLDPEDWEEVRRIGHRMVDDMLEYLATVRTRPVWSPVPDAVRQALSTDVPLRGSPLASVYAEFKQNVLPYPTGNIHPRFWGWVMGTGTPVAMLADMLASGMNSWLGGFDHSATLVEQQVVSWLSAMLGFSGDSSGVLTSGCTTANIIGLAVARHARSPFDVRRFGLQGPVNEAPLVVYCSAETHSWVDKAVELLGIGKAYLRRVPVDSSCRIDIGALHATVSADRLRGLTPLCVIGTAGTVNTGATDDLTGLAGFCRREKLWLHVDGAFGALAALSKKWQSAVTGLASADSIAFDLHKWMYMPFEAGCILVRDSEVHRRTFAATAQYLASQGRGVAPRSPEFVTLGIDMARSFKALKIWMCLKTYGLEAYGRMIEQNIDQAHYLGELIAQDPSLELLAPVVLNVVCFRYRPVPGHDISLDDLNEEIVIRLQESGVAVPSLTRLGNRSAIRVAITNHRSRRKDFEILVEHVVKTGASIAATGGAEASREIRRRTE